MLRRIVNRRSFSAFQKAPAFNYREFPELDQSYMKIVGEEVDKSDLDFQENYQKMQELNYQLDEITRQTMDVGQKMRDLSIKRDKLLPRERINAVIDKGSPFLEIGQLAGYDYMNEDNSVPSGNIIAGIGIINGR
jgi:DNA repair ATPase RecN